MSLVLFQSETHEPKVWHVKFLDVAFQRWPCYQHKQVEHPCSAHQGPAKVDFILTYEQLILFTFIHKVVHVLTLTVQKTKTNPYQFREPRSVSSRDS